MSYCSNIQKSQLNTKSFFSSLRLVYLHIRQRMHHLLQVIRVKAYVIMQDVIGQQSCCGWP